MSWKMLKNALYLPLTLLGVDKTPPSPVQPGTLSDEVNKAGEALQQALPAHSYAPNGMKIVLTLFGLVAFLIIAAWALRKLTASRMGIFSSSKGIKILERKAISPKSALYIVEVEGKKILIAESQLEVRALTTLEKPETDAS